MLGKITHYGTDTRDHLVNFQNKFYRTYCDASSNKDERMCPSAMGRNWSAFVYNRQSRNYLCMFDGDDGSGATPADCKIAWNNFQEQLLDKYNISDYLVFKIQHASLSQHRTFYPFKTDVYPLGLMTNDPTKIFARADALPRVTQDIDVLFVGGKVHDRNKPYCWSKTLNTNQHWPTNRRIGYAKLQEIQSRRSDINMVTVDGLMDANQFYDHVNRSKICVDFPGIGVLSRKFYEFTVLGKCMLALKQHNVPWQMEENVHYCSLGADYDYNDLESKIDMLLADDDLRERFSQNARSCRPKMTFEAVGDYVVKTLDKFVDMHIDGSIDNNRTRYD